MAYSVSSSSYPYPDSRSRPLEASRWDYPLEPTAAHGPRRVQHVYSEATGSYIQDSGSYRRGTVSWDPQPPSPSPSSSSSSSSVYATSGHRHAPSSPAGYMRPSSHSSHREVFSSVAGYPPSPRSIPSSPSTSRAGQSSSSAAGALATPPRTPPHTPAIHRLGTPELAPVSAGLRFCPCCVTDAERLDEQEYLHGRSKMDSQIQHAMAYMSRSSRKSSGRLLKD